MPAGSVARGRIEPSSRNKRHPGAFWPQVLAPCKRYFEELHLAQLDWKRNQAPFDPTIMLTVLIGLAAAAFLATAL